MRMKKMSGEKKTIIFSSVKLSENKISRETFLLKKKYFHVWNQIFQVTFVFFFPLCAEQKENTGEKWS